MKMGIRLCLVMLFAAECSFIVGGGEADRDFAGYVEPAEDVGSGDELWETTSGSGEESEYEVEIEFEVASNDSGPQDSEWWLESASDDDWETVAEGEVADRYEQEHGMPFFIPADNTQEQCPVCLLGIDELSMRRLPCGHGICFGCAHDFYVIQRASRLCPLCRRYASRAFVRAIAEEGQGEIQEDIVGTVSESNNQERSIRRLLDAVETRRISGNFCKHVMCPVLLSCVGVAALAAMKAYVTGNTLTVFE